MKALVLVSLVACVDADEPAPTDSVARITANAIEFGDIVENQELLGQLAQGRLSLDRPAAEAILAHPGGRQVMRFLVGCALAEGIQLGCHGEAFHGQLGLAPHWIRHAPTASELRWVSACMLARVNNYGRAMKISVHGPHAGLYVNRKDRETYTLEEGAFYGNIFTGSAPIIGWSCRGTAQDAGDPGADTAMDSRDCAEAEGATSNVCGWGFSGECGAACDGVHEGPGYYTSCHDADRTNTWTEVITTYVNDGAPID